MTFMAWQQITLYNVHIYFRPIQDQRNHGGRGGNLPLHIFADPLIIVQPGGRIGPPLTPFLRIFRPSAGSAINCILCHAPYTKLQLGLFWPCVLCKQLQYQFPITY